MKKNEARKKSTALVKSDGNGVEKSYAAWMRLQVCKPPISSISDNGYWYLRRGSLKFRVGGNQSGRQRCRLGVDRRNRPSL